MHVTVISKYELSVIENKMLQESKSNKRKETIETFENGKFIKNMPHLDKIYNVSLSQTPLELNVSGIDD